MKKINLIIVSILPIFVQAQDWKTYPYEPNGSKIVFPMDEGRHVNEPEEWWYTTGHVTGETTGNHYSYMLTYFYHPELIFDGFRILNISNDDTGDFRPETAAVNYSVLSQENLNIGANIFMGGTESWKNKTGIDGNAIPFEYTISASGAPGTLNLDYVTQKRPLIIADSGFLYQGNNSYTYYYSQTEITVTGELTFDGVTENVSGKAWIDRQFGNVNPYTGEQYEWFSAKLSNGMDMNIWNIFTAENKVPEGLNYRILASYKDENTQYTISEFSLDRLEYAYTPDEARCYARKWRLLSETDNIDLIISTMHPDYEVSLPFRFYEGPTEISGRVNGESVTGKGFAELLRFYSPPEVEIANLNEWGPSVPLSWELNNPDDGRKVYYALEYSTDTNSFLSIIEDLTNTSYTWSDPPFSDNQEFWIKLKAYSVDRTLSSESVRALTYKENATSANPASSVDLTIFPNPANEIIAIQGQDLESIEIYDQNGNQIYSSFARGNLHEVNIAKFEKGIYLVNILTKRGEYLRRLVIL